MHRSPSQSPLRYRSTERDDPLTTKYHSPSPQREDPFRGSEDPFREDPFSIQYPVSPKREDPRFRSRSPSPPPGNLANLPPGTNFAIPPPNFQPGNFSEGNPDQFSTIFDRLDQRDRLMLEEASQNQASFNDRLDERDRNLLFNDRLDERDRILLAESNQR